MYLLNLIIFFGLLNQIKCFDNSGKNLPCSFHDTVDIENSTKLDNGSYLHEGIVIPPHLIANYSHKYETFRKKIDSESHLRGCICKIKKCIKWCCLPDQIYIFATHECVDHNTTATKNITIMSQKNIVSQSNNLIEYFYGLKSVTPCKHNYALRQHIYEEDKWQLLETGEIILDQEKLTKDEYCLAFDKDESGNQNLVPFICSNTEIEPTSFRDYFYAICLFLSVLCMVVTALIYLCIPELRNLHGKSLICYILNLSIGYAIIVFMLLTGITEISPKACTIIGFVAYYSFISAFFWSSVISFDLWWNFSGRKNQSNYSEKQRFYAYTICCFCLAGLFLFLSAFMQFSNIIPDSYKPGIGGHQYCFLDVETNWSAVFYFYIPLLVMIVFNGIMFKLTALQIHRVQCEMAKLMQQADNQKSFGGSNKQKAINSKFGLYLRLFIIMGVTWIMEFLTYVVGKNHRFSFLIYICDACNILQGFLIFILFVVKKQIKNLIIARYNKLRGREVSRQHSKTTTSNIQMTPLNHQNQKSSSKLLQEKLNNK